MIPEIVSADSRQVYRGLDIGTAKPGREEQRRLRHHLVDIRDPGESFHVGAFVHACDCLVREIHGRGHLPLISGGTAFYLKGFLCGLPETPPASPTVRAELLRRADQEGISPLREELEQVDPASAERIGKNDRYRILRALEVYHATGKPRSSYAEPQRVRQGLNAVVVGLYRERHDLYSRINRRVEEMFQAGLAREVEELFGAGYGLQDPGLRTIGYREFFEVAGPPPWKDDTLAVVQERIARNTRHYARRQELFFRKLPDVRWMHADDGEAFLKVLANVQEQVSRDQIARNPNSNRNPP